MRRFSFLLFMLLMQAIASAQAYTRYAGQTADSLVRSTLDEYSVFTGMQEFNTYYGSFILYFQNEYEIKRPAYTAPGNTVFNVLFTADGREYRKYAIGTVNKGNPCWLAARLDSLLFFNVDEDPELEVAVVLRHDPRCDAYLPYTSVLFFDNIEQVLKTGTLKPFPNLTLTMLHGFIPLQQLRHQVAQSLKSIHPAGE